MTLETLVATVDQKDHSLVEKMNIQTDAIIGNQGSATSREIFLYNGNSITYINTNDRGVGKNRNLLLDNASSELCILADDDMRFVDGYPEIAQKAFLECPKADVLVFNLIEQHPRRFIHKKITTVRWYNYARYGAARLAFRRSSLLDSGISFSTHFGGGAPFGSGEDTVFLHDCLKAHLKIIAVPYFLAEIDQSSSSTWFTGYNDKFFFDKGALFAHLHTASWPLFVLRFLLRYRKKFGAGFSIQRALVQMCRGRKEYITNWRYSH